MDTHVLEQFVAVAEDGNVTRAAERLFVAQSTVSAAVRSLERELGATLFDRTTRRLVLTPSGAEVLAQARTALAAVDRMRDAASTSDATLRGRVRLGIFTSMDVVDLIRVLRAFRARHPLVDVELVTSASGTTGLVQDMMAGRLDLAYSGLVETPDGTVVHPLVTLPFRVFVAPDHPLAARSAGDGRRSVSLAELVDEPFVDSVRGFGNRILLDRALEARGLQRRIVAEMNDMPAVVRFAAAGLGVGVVPDAGQPHDAVVLELEDDVPPLRIGLAVRTDPEPNRATTTLARDIVAAAATVSRAGD